MQHPSISVRAALAVATLAFGASAAQAAVLVRSLKELEKGNGALNDLGGEYYGLSAANVVFAQCATTYPDEIQKNQEFLTQRFAKTWADYQNAYRDAYTKRVGTEPDQAFMDKVKKRALDVQQQAVNETAHAIAKIDCKSGRIHRIVEYVDKLRHAAEHPKQPKKEDE